jgi:hypothetical protein
MANPPQIPDKHFAVVNNVRVQSSDAAGVQRVGKDRQRCLSAMWSNVAAIRTMRFVAWSWLRSVRPTLAQWEDTSDFLAARSPDDNNAVEQDGSLTGNCVFLWHTTPQLSIQKSQLFYLSSIRLWHTRCHPHDCARVCPRLIPNWIIAFECSVVKSQQQ